MKDLILEYLFVSGEKPSIRCDTVDTFNNFIRSDKRYKIEKNELTFNENLTVNYLVEVGKVGQLDSADGNYFHIKITHNNLEDIEKFTELAECLLETLKPISVPQILADTVSLYYSSLAYPQIYEVENLMRKLVTKIMYIKGGANWQNNSLPEHIRKDTPDPERSTTYLQIFSIDKLKDILLNEKFPVATQKIIDYLKKSIKNPNLKISIEDLKAITPISIWDNYFSKEISINAEVLRTEWDKLSKLRNKVAHNSTFTKSDLMNLEKTIAILSKAITEVVEKFDDFSISQIEDIEQNVISNSGNNIEQAWNNRKTNYLFNNNLLKVGDKVVYEPAKRNGINVREVTATIKREGMYCLQIDSNQDKLYSFSGLKRKFIKDFNLDVNPNWGYTTWQEWTTENGNKLADLTI